VVVNAGTSSMTLPLVGGANGCLLADEFHVANLTAATINLYGNVGSTIYAQVSGLAVSAAAATTGVSIASGKVGCFWPVTASTWVGVV
jgi:hypothetical protein